MRRYELIYILRPNSAEDEINKVIDYAGKIVADEKGTIIDLNKWGMRKLAYPIKKELQGYYVFCDYAGTPAAVTEIERRFRIDDSVLKYLTVKVADTISDAEIEEAITETQARNEAAIKAEAEAAAAEETGGDSEPKAAQDTESESAE